MIQRRQFLGTVAAFCTASTAVTRPSDGSVVPSGTDWRCEVIETVAHNRDLRSPVVTAVSLQPQGDLLAIVGDDHYVCLYNTVEKKFVEHLKQHTDWIRTARFSPDGSRLATAGNDRSLIIWKTDQWMSPAVIQRNPQAIIDLAFDHNGAKLATVGFESTLRIFDVVTGDLMEQLQCPCPDNHAVAFSNDQRYLAAGGRSGVIRIWDMLGGRQPTDIKAHRQRIRSLAFTRDGRILSASDDQRVKLTDPTQAKATESLPRQPAKLYATAMLDDQFIATGGSDNQIHIWQFGTLQKVNTLKGHTGTISCLDYSRSRLVSGSYDTHVRLWSTDQHTSSSEQRQTELRSGWSSSLK